MALPVNIEQLLSATTVEGNRIEYKKGWNPDVIYRTICAFANDFDNVGGGYIIVGADEENGRALRPVIGVDIEKNRDHRKRNDRVQQPYQSRLLSQKPA